jgi:nitrogen PTS system EIIA component
MAMAITMVKTILTNPTAPTLTPVAPDTLKAIFAPERILVRQSAQTPQAVFSLIAQTAAATLPYVTAAGAVLTRLVERESLASTGIGHGVAIPHARLPGLPHIAACVVQLVRPINFKAIDHQPVDLICALIVPLEATQQHLLLLSTLAQLFSDEAFRQQLRNAHTPRRIYECLCRTGGNVLV